MLFDAISIVMFVLYSQKTGKRSYNVSSNSIVVLSFSDVLFVHYSTERTEKLSSKLAQIRLHTNQVYTA